ncbi:MAG: glycosyltransferase family 4 protein [Deltaproteobacteria bacterium]|nr:glycosyltransferase family 4 protein [Deltaproteobacteria bacterium]
MRVALLVDCYFPTTKSAAKLMHDLGAELRTRGHDVSLIAPAEGLDGDLHVADEDGLRIVRIRSGRLKGAARWARGLREVRLSATMWRRGRRHFAAHPCDLLVYYSPTVFFGALVRKLKALWGCPAYLVLRDIWPQFLVETGVLGHGPLYWLFRRRELEQHEAADVIGVQSPGDLTYFAEHFPRRNFRVEVLHNWATLHEPEHPPAGHRRRLGLADKVVFFFGGNFGIAQDMDNLLRLATALRDVPEAAMLLVGGGSETPRVAAGIRERGLTNVVLHPAVDPATYMSMVSEFDVGLISLAASFRIQNIPGKLLGYLYFALPVLASVNPGNDLRAILHDADAGLCCLNGQDEEFARLARRLAGDRELRDRMGRNGRKLLETRFSAASAADQILGHWTSRRSA